MNRSKKLEIQQLDEKIHQNDFLEPPPLGWARAVRSALNMSLVQLAKKMGVSPPTLLALERREMEGTVTLKSLRRAASALNMQLVYGFLPKDGSLEKMIEKQALIVAQDIVSKTNTTMTLENQQVSKERLKKSVRELTEEIKSEIPKYLWD